MKKVINITLGSVVFAIEQDAFDALESYLSQIKANLTSGDDATEVIEDVERAIAEKFIARKRSEKLAVTVVDVSEVMSEMGNPSDFGEGEAMGGNTQTVEANDVADEPRKRLYRDTDDAIIAGVASGLARYFSIDPVIIRLIFVVLIFVNGIGILAYAILWLVVPVATTTADKYAMRGERVTLKDISERVKKNLQSIEESDLETAKGAWTKVRHILDKVFKVLGVVVASAIVVARYVVGIVFIVAGALGVAGMVSIYSAILLSDKVLFPADVQLALETLQGSALGIVAMGSSFIMMSIPLLVLIVAGASMLAKRNFFTVQKSVTLAVVWIVAAAVAGTTSALQVEQVMQKIGPMEGRFNDSSFEVEWEGGRIYGNENHVNFESNVPNPPAPPERIIITGTYDCIDENATINPPSESCMQGIRTSEGELYALDFMLMSMTPPVLEAGDTITVTGPFIPAERMSASWWHESEVEGQLSATSLEVAQ